MSRRTASRKPLAGRLLGTISAAAAAGLWLAALAGAGSDPAFAGASRYLAGALCLLSVGAAAAAWAGRAGPATALGLLSFVPMGLYMLGAENWLRWIGVANLGYLAGVTLLWVEVLRGRRAAGRPPASG